MYGMLLHLRAGPSQSTFPLSVPHEVQHMAERPWPCPCPTVLALALSQSCLQAAPSSPRRHPWQLQPLAAAAAMVTAQYVDQAAREAHVAAAAAATTAAAHRTWVLQRLGRQLSGL